MNKNIENFEDYRSVHAFLKGELSFSDSHSHELYKFFLTLIDENNHPNGKNIKEYDMCKFLINLNQLDITEEVRDYISFIRLKANIDDVFKAKKLGNFEFVTKKDGIDELIAFGEIIQENKYDIRNNFIRVCRNILMKPSEITIYDIDFMIIGFCQETQYVGVGKFIEKIINISETYPIHNGQTPFKNSIVFKYYKGEHLEYLKEVLDKH